MRSDLDLKNRLWSKPCCDYTNGTWVWTKEKYSSWHMKGTFTFIIQYIWIHNILIHRHSQPFWKFQGLIFCNIWLFFFFFSFSFSRSRTGFFFYTGNILYWNGKMILPKYHKGLVNFSCPGTPNSNILYKQCRITISPVLEWPYCPKPMKKTSKYESLELFLTSVHTVIDLKTGRRGDESHHLST